MSLFNKKSGGFMDVIKCDEPSYLIWKWRPNGAALGEGTRENSIRWGSSLRVKDGEVAVFVYKQNEEQMQDFIVGPFDDTIKTSNFPVLSNLVGLLFNGESPFQAEIYFINLARVIQTKFGVPYFDIYDPRYVDFGVPVAVRGTITFKISDYKEFIKLHRLISFDIDDFQSQIKDAVNRYVKSAVINIPKDNNIPVVQIESRTGEVNDIIEKNVKDKLKETFGVDVSSVDIGTIEIDKTSEGYAQLMSVTKDVTTAKVKADVENYEESLRIQREEGQFALHRKTLTDNLGAYQIEKQAEVGVESAKALGHMGENGAGTINIGDGGSGTGFNPVAMMAGMALGGAVGQNIAGNMNNILGNNNTETMAPPPIPTEKYFVAIDGKQLGPYDINTLKTMAEENKITKDSLVWKKGMADWEKIENVDNLKDILLNIPPIPDSK